MKSALVVALLAMVCMLPAQPQAATAGHNAAVERDTAVMGMQRVLTPRVMDDLSVVPATGRLRVAHAIFGALDNHRVHRAVSAALLQTFTKQELDAMAVFFGSPVRQSILDKRIDFTSPLNLILRDELLAAMERSRQRIGQ